MKMPAEQKKNICCISVMQSWGGGELFLLELGKNLHDYDFVIITPEGPAKKKFDEAGLKTRSNNYQKKIYRNGKWNLLSFIRISLNILFSSFRLLKLFRDEKPSLILANGLFASLYVLPAAVLSGRKFITVQHLIFSETSIEQKIINLVYRSTRKIVCVSEAVKENLLKLSGKDKEQKLIVINNGITTPPGHDDVRRVQNKVRIGMVGSIIRIKGIHLVIEAVRDFIKSGTADFIIYGTTTEASDSAIYKAELRERIQEYGIEDKVLFKGHVDSKENIYPAFDIFISYSLVPEAFPFSVLEAMLYGNVVIAADRGGPREIIQDGISGFLVEPENVDKLKEKILYCIENYGNDSLEMVRKNAKERIKNNFSIEKFAANYQSLFHKILKKTE